MKRYAALILVICLSISLPMVLDACSPGTPPSQIVASGLAAAPEYPKGIALNDYAAMQANRTANPVSLAAKDAIDAFTYRTAVPLLTAAKANSCYSPLSLYFALALAGTGANARTRDELLALLGASDSSSLAKEMGSLYRRLYTDNEVARLKIANSLWLDDTYQGQKVQFKDAFLGNATKDFYASLYKVDFARPEAGKLMAQWIAEQTNGTLNPAFATNPEQILSIINTVYFKSEWVDRFDAAKTGPAPFHLADGKDVTCDFMNMTNPSHGFSRGDGFTRAALSLKSNGQMVFILPDQGRSVQELVSTPERLRSLFEGGDTFNGKVIWKIPKFTFASYLMLADTLKSLGIRSAFEPDADFTGITDHQAFISDIIQQTHIAIDEKGVEASAFTKIDYAGAAQPTSMAEMILDRPFLFAIFSAPVAASAGNTPQAQPGSPLFIGICANPASQK